MAYLVVCLRRTLPTDRFSAQMMDHLTNLSGSPDQATFWDRVRGLKTHKERGYCHAEVAIVTPCESDCLVCRDSLSVELEDGPRGSLHTTVFVVNGRPEEPRVHVRETKFKGVWAFFHRPLTWEEHSRVYRFLRGQCYMPFNSSGTWRNFFWFVPDCLKVGHTDQDFEPDHMCRPHETWFCSELVSAAILVIDPDAFNGMAPRVISPNQLNRVLSNKGYRPDLFEKGFPPVLSSCSKAEACAPSLSVADLPRRPKSRPRSNRRDESKTRTSTFSDMLRNSSLGRTAREQRGRAARSSRR